MAIARSGGVNELLAAGAILSGVYFGDRCSPTASSANLIAALTKTDLYGNVGRMFRTALIPTVVCIAAYCFLSFNNPLYISNAGYLAEIKKDFVISWWALLPVAVMFCFPLMRIRVKYALIVSSAAACLIACAVQGESAAELLHTAVFGYYPQDAVMGDIWNGGGLVSMAGIIMILAISSTYAKILSVSGLLRQLNEIVEAMMRRIGKSCTVILSSLFASGIFCSQITSCIMAATLLKKQYTKRGQPKEELALDLENSLVIIAPMVPWCLSCSVPLKLLGVGVETLRWEFYIFLIPICYFLGKEIHFPRASVYRRFLRSWLGSYRFL
ncbi:MAG: sodium:proton antiporter [Cloacibacillus porcorum]|nr:sodium:proton antiporter [Cloacibacillus porcorum]